MGLRQRLEFYGKIETHRKRPLLVYVTSKREGVNASMATDALPYLIDQLDQLPKDATNIDFLIVSLGGDPMVAWRIMSLIRERVDTVSVLIPQSAYSAATLLALGANEIIMHPNGHLGPVDMQITTVSEGQRKQFSTEDISAFLDFVRDDLAITDQKHVRRLFEMMCKEVSSLGVGFTARTSRLAVALGEQLLNLHIDNDESGAKKKALLENMSRQFHSHAYPVSRQEAIKVDLPVVKDRDTVLEELMWKLWLDLEEELQERVPFHPILELLNSPEAATLLSPIPQLNLPPNAAQPSNFQADVQTVIDKSKFVNPVEFSTIEAIMESSRLANWSVAKGKILASMQPDLTLQYNRLFTFRGWEKKHP
jgi:hypothetical protein